MCSGVIAGAGTNHSAEAVSITHPHAGHQSYLNKLVLSQAGIDPLQVGFVESKLHPDDTQRHLTLVVSYCAVHVTNLFDQ